MQICILFNCDKLRASLLRNENYKLIKPMVYECERYCVVVCLNYFLFPVYNKVLGK